MSRGKPLTGALLGLVLSGLTMTGLAPTVLAATSPPNYLILPFENLSEEPSLDWLSTGLALALGEYLRGAGARVIDDEERAIVLEGNGIPPGASLTLASTLELGRKLRARSTGIRPDLTIIGRFEVTDGDLTLQARVIDLTREHARPWVVQEARLRDLLKAHGRLANDLLVLDRRPSRFDAFGDPPLLAFETYCRAMAETDSVERLKMLKQAIHEYPDYYRAAYQAAALLVKGERWDDAEEMLERVANNPRPYGYEFHMAQAEVSLEVHNPDKAAAAAVHAIAELETSGAYILLGRARLAQGDQGAARTALQRAEALDPTDPELDTLRAALDRTAATGKAVR